MRMDCVEFVFASSRFCLKKRRLIVSMVSADGWGAIGGSLRRAIRADRYVGVNYTGAVLCWSRRDGSSRTLLPRLSYTKRLFTSGLATTLRPHSWLAWETLSRAFEGQQRVHKNPKLALLRQLILHIALKFVKIYAQLSYCSIVHAALRSWKTIRISPTTIYTTHRD
jgi:hypothetical protein